MTESMQRLARYPNLETHRMRVGWTPAEIAQKLNNIPSEKSVKRAEKGEPIKAVNIYKIFNLLHREYTNVTGTTLNDKEEIVVHTK